MGWSDRDASRSNEPAGFWANARRVLGRVFGDADNPLGWSLPLYRLWGIAVRVHLLFVALILVRVLVSAFDEQLGIGHTLLWMSALFVLVLLHEYGHCVACRWRGGEADQILMWPLGGLASCLPPDTWRDNLITTAGGPAVNLALMPILGGAVYFMTGRWDAVFFNPFDLGGVIFALDSWTAYALFWVHAMNAFLFIFNVFLPMYPMDGGRLLQTILWARIGKDRSMSIATTVGLVCAVVLGLLALSAPDTGMLLAIALFGGLTCWSERQRLKFAATASEFGYAGPAGEPWRASLKDDDDRPAPAAEKRAEKRAEQEAKLQAEIDRILAKISKTGMGSLTRAEKRTLEKASKNSASR